MRTNPYPVVTISFFEIVNKKLALDISLFEIVNKQQTLTGKLALDNFYYKSKHFGTILLLLSKIIIKGLLNMSFHNLQTHCVAIFKS